MMNKKVVPLMIHLHNNLSDRILEIEVRLVIARG